MAMYSQAFKSGSPRLPPDRWYIPGVSTEVISAEHYETIVT